MRKTLRTNAESVRASGRATAVGAPVAGAEGIERAGAVSDTRASVPRIKARKVSPIREEVKRDFEDAGSNESRAETQGRRQQRIARGDAGTQRTTNRAQRRRGAEKATIQARIQRKCRPSAEMGRLEYDEANHVAEHQVRL